MEETCSRNSNYTRTETALHRDPQLEEFVRRVQVMAAQFETLAEPDLGEHRNLIYQAIPVSDSHAGRAIACAILLDVIARLAVAKQSPPDVPLLFSAAKLGGKLDLSGLSMMLTTPSCRTSATVTGGDPRVEKTLLLIRANYRQPSLTLRPVAEEVHLSPWHLSRLLMHHTGLSFKRHLDEARLRNGTALLEQTFLSIKEVAHSCGFGSVETFERAFKKRFGCPPKQWRAFRDPEQTNNCRKRTNLVDCDAARHEVQGISRRREIASRGRDRSLDRSAQP